MNIIKERIRNLIRKAGYDVVPYKPGCRGKDPLLDVKHFIGATPSPLIVDVGANIGQSILRFKAIAPGAKIHSFEPSPTTFAQLQQNHAAMGWKDVRLWHSGVGAENSTRALLEHDKSVMSSFLPAGELCDGQAVTSTPVDIVTLDSFAAANNIDYIHLLKSDTQGFEYEVFKGARRLFSEGRVGMVLFECIVSNQYQGVAPFETILDYLAGNNFSLVGIYNQHFQRALVSWMDVLVISREYYQRVQRVS